MGKKNFLIEGVSGAGKTTVAEELERRGFQAIHGDRELRYRGNPETGEKISPENYIHTPVWMSEHQLWDLEKVKSHIEDQSFDITFFCGGSRNHSKFIPWLDGVFILDVDKETMMRRIDERVAKDPTDFGAKPQEKELILKLHTSKEDIPNTGIVIDATQSLESVVNEIIKQCKSL